MDYKVGFDKEAFERDHFGFKRGSREKYFFGWEGVRYEGGFSPHAFNERELADGNMTKPLYDFLEHLYGTEQMAKYFPKPEAEKMREPSLHFSPSSLMAFGVDGKRGNGQTDFSKPMTDEEIDELARLLAGGRW